MNKHFKKSFLIESAWEVCNQVGGIYTVIRSKILSQKKQWGDNYLLLGPYFDNQEFEPIEDPDSKIYQVCKRMQEQGIDAKYGTWLVSGNPKVVLLNPFSIYNRLGEIKFEIWEKFGIESTTHDDLKDQVIAFGFLSQWFIHDLVAADEEKSFVAHFHEWMAGLPIPYLNSSGCNIKTLFTTHATLLGRYLAMNDPNFYENLPYANWEKEAQYFNVETQVKLERSAAHGANILTTVSDVTAEECVYLLGRKPEFITPNGLNIDRYEALHKFQSLHLDAKRKIHDFVTGHFFPSYKFDLDKTLYFFTSGRFEYNNKGYDLTLEALARLNHLMHVHQIDMNVVMFLVTKQPVYSISAQVLQSRAMMDELKHTCTAIEKDISQMLFRVSAGNSEDKLPDLNALVPEHTRLQFRRAMQGSKTNQLPTIVTHELVNRDQDPVINFLTTANLVNNEYDKVKMVYHPDFISSTSPLFHMDYDEFVRGCHLGVFPSYYEPWGYTPVECLVRGIPSITSDLSGFGDYVLKNLREKNKEGLYIVDRKYRSFNEAADQLAHQMLDFVQLNRRDRINQRNNVEQLSTEFDWEKLLKFYTKAYIQVLKD